MIKIDSSKMIIEATRADTIRLSFSALKQDGTEYYPSAGDRLVFAVAKKCGAEPLLTVVNTYDGDNDKFWEVIIRSADTKSLKFGDYVWDIQLENKDGVFTIIGKTDDISPTFRLWGEVSAETRTYDTPDYIKIEKLPNKLTYTDGESLDLTGMVVKAHYEDGSERTIPNEELTISPRQASESIYDLYSDGNGLNVLRVEFASYPYDITNVNGEVIDTGYTNASNVPVGKIPEYGCWAYEGDTPVVFSEWSRDYEEGKVFYVTRYNHPDYGYRVYAIQQEWYQYGGVRFNLAFMHESPFTRRNRDTCEAGGELISTSGQYIYARDAWIATGYIGMNPNTFTMVKSTGSDSERMAKEFAEIVTDIPESTVNPDGMSGDGLEAVGTWNRIKVSWSEEKEFVDTFEITVE